MEIGRASISLAHTGSMPQCTAASGNTPIPSNRLPSLSTVTRIPRAAHRAMDTTVAGADFLTAHTGKAVTMLVRVQVCPAVRTGVVVHEYPSCYYMNCHTICTLNGGGLASRQ